MKSIIRILVVVPLIFLLTCAVAKNEIPSSAIEIMPIIELNSLTPKINVNVMSVISQNFFATDKDNNLYFVDCMNHRVLKYDPMGSFIRQIGSIGQGAEDLFNPFGIFIDDDILYILNKFGCELKFFSENGEYLKSFQINDALRSDSISVQSNKIAISIKYKKKANYDSNKLISIFNIDGTFSHSIGKIIKTNSYKGFHKFNSVFINRVENIFFGAFQNPPVIFANDLSGEELYYKDLREYNLPEIVSLMKKEKSLKLDTPETKITTQSIKSIKYCHGFCTNSHFHVFYAINMYDAAINTEMRSVIYHFDEYGQPIEKIFPMRLGENIEIKNLYIDKGNTLNGIGVLNGNAFLFKLLKGGD